jgi:hypothetical protein
MKTKKNILNDKDTSSTKKVMVKCLDWLEGFDIEDIYDDIYMEASTRFIEYQFNKRKQFKLAPIMICYLFEDKDNIERQYVYNSYYVLINAAQHSRAELLRQTFMKTNNVDLKEESINGKYDPKFNKN